MRSSIATPLGLCMTLVFLPACNQEYPFQFQRNQRVAGRGYTIDVGTAEKTDVLFVVDNSGNMAEEQAELRDNIAAFVEVLTQSANDYQVGLISTDLTRRPGPNCLPCCDRDTDDDGLPDWSNCDNGRLYAADSKNRIFKRPALIEDQTEAEYQARVDVLIQSFNETIVSLGIAGSALEAPLEAMRRALDPSGEPLVRAVNNGFLRDDAGLAVVFLTDEDDCSFSDDWYQGRDDAHCYFEEGAIPISDYVDFLVELKGDIDAIRAAAIVGGVTVTDPDGVRPNRVGSQSNLDQVCHNDDNSHQSGSLWRLAPHCV